MRSADDGTKDPTLRTKREGWGTRKSYTGRDEHTLFSVTILSALRKMRWHQEPHEHDCRCDTCGPSHKTRRMGIRKSHTGRGEHTLLAVTILSAVRKVRSEPRASAS